jgi:hypothetical protein
VHGRSPDDAVYICVGRAGSDLREQCQRYYAEQCGDRGDHIQHDAERTGDVILPHTAAGSRGRVRGHVK